MAVSPLELRAEGASDRHPLLMDQSENANRCLENRDRQDHIIDISRAGTAPEVPLGYGHNDQSELHHDDVPSTSSQAPIVQPPPSSAAPNSRNTTFTRRGDAYNRRHRSPLNSGLWISIELVVNMSQVVAAIVVLSLSKHEKPHTPLLEWIIGYTAGCVATLPHLYWRYIHRNSQGTDQESVQAQSGSSTTLPEAVYSSSVIQAPSSGSQHNIATDSQTSERTSGTSPRINSIVEHLKMALDCFFAVWFVVGNVWIFGGRSSASTAPNLYRLCIVFLTFSCIGYAMPFILCATICCCLPCIISILGFREDLGQNRGATPEVINSLPVYKYKMKRTKSMHKESSSDGAAEGGIIAAGTDKERIISNDDASCCICLAKYANNDELRELPCTHFFHKDCVDKWLKINALCPLCKYEIGEVAHPTSFDPSHGQ